MNNNIYFFFLTHIHIWNTSYTICQILSQKEIFLSIQLLKLQEKKNKQNNVKKNYYTLKLPIFKY